MGKVGGACGRGHQGKGLDSFRVIPREQRDGTKPHFETLMIRKPSSKKFTAQNDVR